MMSSVRRLPLPVSALVVLIALVVYRFTLAPGLTFAHDGADGGDLIAAAFTLGVPHPSGYPTYTLLAWLATYLPLGTIAYRVNLLSAACAALAAGLFCASARRLLPALTLSRPGGEPAEGWVRGDRPSSPLWPSEGTGGTEGGPPILIPFAASLSLAFSSLVWSQAVIAEVYTLLLLFAAMLLWLIVDWRHPNPGGRTGAAAAGNLWLAALILGLGLGNHLALIFMVPGALVLLWPERRRWLRPLVILPALILFLAGLSVYAYLPFAASHQPPVNWGDPRTWSRFWWLVSGQIYYPYVFGLGLGAIPGRLAAWAGLLGDQFGWWGLVLVLLGAWRCWQRDRVLALAALAWGLPAAVYAFFYATSDSHIPLLPLLLPLALAWALGAQDLIRLVGRTGSVQTPGTYSGSQADLLARRLPIRLIRSQNPLTAILSTSSEHPLVWRRVALLIVVVLLPLASLAFHWPAADLSRDKSAQTAVRDLLDAAPYNALVVTRSDQTTFALWYALYAQGLRPDLAAVNEPLLAYDWYRANLRALYPDLFVPEPSGPTVSAADLVRALILGNEKTRPVYIAEPGRTARLMPYSNR